MLVSEIIRPESVMLTDLAEGYPTILKQFQQRPIKRWAIVRLSQVRFRCFVSWAETVARLSRLRRSSL